MSQLVKMASELGTTTSAIPSYLHNKTTDDDSLELLPDIRQPVYMVVVYSMAYGIIFLFALFGNIVVVAVVLRNRRMHNLTNLFIVNLAVADILVAVFCMPITLLQSLYNGWRYGAIMCKVTPYLQGVSVSASVNTLAVIAVDRYIAICFSLQHKMTWKIAKIIMVFIWIFSLCLVVPWLLYHQLERVDIGHQVFYLCSEKWPFPNGKRIYFLLLVTVCYIIPLTLIILCYLMIALRVWNRNAPGIFRYSKVIQKSKVKVVKMFVIVVLLFALSWLPLYTCFIIMYFNPPPDGSEKQSFLVNIAVPIAQWLGQANSGMNPIIYCFFSKAIRKRTITLLSCSSHSSSDLPRRQSRFSSSRCMSVDYANGQITLKLNKRKDGSLRSTKCTNTFCENTSYD